MGQKGNPIFIVQKRLREFVGKTKAQSLPAGDWNDTRAYDDRTDARDYCERMNRRKNAKFEYRVNPVKVKMY